MYSSLLVTSQILFILWGVESNGAVDGCLGDLEIIPSNFQDQNLSSYTIRYLASESSDGPDCLENQPFPAPLSNVTACGTLAYVLETRIRTRSRNRSIVGRIKKTIIFITPGVYGLEKGITADESEGLIVAKHPEETGEVIFQCNDNSNSIYNFEVSDSIDVAIYGITGTKCGPNGAAMRIIRSQRVTMSDCMFRNNLNCGIIILRCTDIVIENTQFINNNASSQYYNNTALVSRSFRVSGGLTISFQNQDLVPSGVTVKNCRFVNNSAMVDEVNRQDSMLRPSSYTPRGHGGGLLVFFRNTSNHSVHIVNSFFSTNMAEFAGGAVAILFYRGSEGVSCTKNRVLLEKNTFMNNNSPHGAGGAIGSTSFDGAHSNRIEIKDCEVIENSAKSGGGGFSFIVEDNVESDDDYSANNITITNTTFVRNKTPTGGGAMSFVYFSRADQVNSDAVISMCNFTENKALFGGAIYSLRHTLEFKGHNTFTMNLLSSWYFISTHATCDGNILFHKNCAVNGGAVSLHQEAAITFRKDVIVTFLQNAANNSGGAVFVSSPPLTADLTSYQQLSQRCFFEGSSFAKNIAFIGNIAGLDGAAIFATDINTCSYTLDAKEESKAGKNTDLIFHKEPFVFMNNTVTNNPHREIKNPDLATEPFVLVTLAPNDTILGAPGEKLSFHIGCLDQQGNNRSCFWSSNFQPGGVYALSEEGEDMKYQVPDLNYYHLTKKEFEAKCNRNVRETIRFSVIQTLTSDLINVTEVTLNITCCHPGYTLYNDSVNHTCSLTPLLNENAAVLRPDEKHKFFYVKPAFYAEERSGKIVTAPMPIIYQNCTHLGSLSGCLFKYNDKDDQCANGRSGFLCGICPDGATVDITLSVCLTCYWWHSFLQALFTIVWVVFCILVMIYNIGIPNKFKGFLFYVQVIGYLFDHATNGVTWDNHVSNIGYFTYWPLCIYTKFGALATASRGFFVAFTMILTIVAYIISARFIKRLSNKTSFDGIWLLSFFMYKFVADSCYSILRCQRVNGEDPYEFVYHYNGNYKCFSREDHVYLVFGVTAIIFSIILFIFPFFILVISFKRFLLTQNITDVLNKGIKPSCRWWNSFDLYRRLLFSVMILLFHYIDSSFTELSLFISSLLVFVVFAFASPYTCRKAYYMEALLLLDLVLVSGIFLNSDSKVQQRMLWLTSLLLILPYFVAILYFICKFIAFLWIKTCPESYRLAGQAYVKKLRNFFPPYNNFDTKKKSSIPPINAQFQDMHSTNPGVSSNISSPGVEDSKTFMQYREELLSSTVT